MPSDISRHRKLSYIYIYKHTHKQTNKQDGKVCKHNNYGAFTPLFYHLRGDKVAFVAAFSNIF